MSGTRTGQVKRTHSDDDDFDDIPQLNLGSEPVENDLSVPLLLKLDPPDFFPQLDFPQKRNAEKTETVSHSDDRVEVLSISFLEGVNAWMEALRTALENRHKDTRNGRQSSIEFLWKLADDAHQALFCGRKVIYDAREYQIDIENCLINFTLAVTARSPDIVSAIWFANGERLIKKISKLPSERQIDLLDKVLRNNLGLIYPYVAGVMDDAVLEVVKKNLSGNSKATCTKRTILQTRINALFEMECQAIAHTQLISYPVLPESAAAGLAQFGLLPRPPVPVPLDPLNEDVMEALMLLGHGAAKHY